MSKKIFFEIFLASGLYFILPVYLAGQTKLIKVFYLTTAAIAIYLFKKHLSRVRLIKYQTSLLQEKLNILNDQCSVELKSRAGLEDKISRYNGLKKILDELNKNLDIEIVSDNIAQTAFSVISNNKGACLLYLANKQSQGLTLFKTKKEDKKLAIKVKEGDIFDFWVLKHTSPLLIEDIKNDFRFDPEKLLSENSRPIRSLISAPLVNESTLLGILRLDNPQSLFYSQDDLRFLVKICDLGAVALENAQLFQKTQELAIHDSLTDAYTKGYFLQRLEETCRRAARLEGGAFSLLMIDIDFFKNYNDKFGHAAGDVTLKKTVNCVTQTLKNLNPFVARFGGEEFCVLLERANKKKAYRAALELCANIAQDKLILRRSETRVTVSIGVAEYPSDARLSDELIQAADRALYEAKQMGRNRAVEA